MQTFARTQGYVWPFSEFEEEAWPQTEELWDAMKAALEHHRKTSPGEDLRVTSVYRNGEYLRVCVESA